MTTIIKQMTPNYITFEVDSDSRNLKHEIIFNRITREWSCTCEDFFYRKRMCKHTRQCKELLNSLIFECNTSNKIYKGETLKPTEIGIKI